MGEHDLSVQFLDTVSQEFPAVRHQVEAHHYQCDDSGCAPSFIGESHAQSLAADYGLNDINLVKAGVSETVRMLLYRILSGCSSGPTPGAMWRTSEGLRPTVACRSKNVPICFTPASDSCRHR